MSIAYRAANSFLYKANFKFFFALNDCICRYATDTSQLLLQLNYIIFTALYYTIRKGGDPPDLECLIAKEILPVRSDRHYSRNVKAQGFVSFAYRFN